MTGPGDPVDGEPLPAWAPHLPAGVDPRHVDLGAGRSLPAAWLDRWAPAPAAPVLHDRREGWVTAGAFESRTRAVAARLAAAGLEPGDRVLLSGEASVALAAAHVGALRAGLVVVPVNTALREREVAHIARDAQPRLAIVDDGLRGRWAAGALDDPLPVTDLSVALPDGPDPAHLDAVGPDEGALLVYTSGTTGAPKGALLSHANLLASAEALRIAWRWTTEDRLVLTLPLFHLHGLGVGLHGTLGAGASAVLQPGFDPATALDAMGEHRATLFFGVPTMYRRLEASGRLEDLSPLRLCVSGSAPLPAELHRVVAERGGQRIVERYGMTETVMNVSNPYDGDRRPGTVGLPLPGVEVRLDPATDEIELRGPNVFAGYWRRPDATAEAFDGDWFRTGDVGSFDHDGYLRIVGRRKELIISGGYNVYPREVEDVLREHLSVEDVAVVGLPHPDWGEQVVAVVEGGAEGDEAALRAHAADRLAPYKRPKRFVFVAALPRNALGKVVKERVVEAIT